MTKYLARIGAGLVFAVLAIVAWNWYAPGPAKDDTVVVIPKGAALQSATDYLHYAGAVNRREIFYYLARLLGDKDPIQAGEFMISKGASYSDILDLLQEGQPIQRTITIPEGLPAILVQERLEEIEHAEGDAPLPEEGAVLPNTYSYERGEDRSAILARMTSAMDDAMKELWPKRSARSVVNTPEEAIILASIVEKETAKAEERAMVAGVLSNRIRIGMALGADATTIYPITKGKPLGRMIRRSELAADNGYNTRRKRGLPVGPITNPGRESIEAVLNPAETDALYYVADGSGGHVFAKTLQEHNENVAKWRAFREEQGI